MVKIAKYTSCAFSCDLKNKFKINKFKLENKMKQSKSSP